jgi:hypothetical protein
VAVRAALCVDRHLDRKRGRIDVNTLSRAAPRLALCCAMAAGAWPVAAQDPMAAAPAAPVGEQKWQSMPDLLGIHLGMPVDNALAVLKREYPTARVQLWEIAPRDRPTIAEPLASGASLPPGATGPFGDEVHLHFTYPPNARFVYAVSRSAQRQHVNRDTLLAALRNKYGKEVARNPDPLISDLWWVFDQQGRLAAAPGDGTLTLGNCRWPVSGGSIDELRLSQSGWCESAHIAVRARLDSHNDPEIVETLHMQMIDLPLALRAAAATIAWRDALHAQERQQEIERTKKASPKL